MPIYNVHRIDTEGKIRKLRGQVRLFRRVYEHIKKP